MEIKRSVEARALQVSARRFLMHLLLVLAFWASPAYAGEALIEDPRTSSSSSQEGEDLRADALPWLDPSPAIVTLKGYVVRKRFYGPPGYGETPKEDYNANAWLLLLDEPINIRDDEKRREYEVRNVRRVHLVIIKGDKTLWKKMRGLFGEEVYATGKLYIGETGWYWTPIGLDLQSLDRVPRGTCDSDCRR